MTKVSAVHQQPCQVLSQIQRGTQREDCVPHQDSPTASQRVSAVSFAHVQNSFNLVLWLQGSPSSQGTNADCSALLQGILDGDLGTCLSRGA